MKTHRLIGVGREGKFFGLQSLKLWLATLMFSGLLFISATVGATTILSQSFTSSAKLPTGSIVSLQRGSTDHVDGAAISNADYILGAIVDSGNSQLSISSDQNNQVSVATSGIERVLVSDINGDIKSGDPITASPINGVGMKATGNVKVVGVAQDTFPNSTAKKQAYKDQSGKNQTVKLGDVSVLINVTYYYKQPDKTLIPSALQNLANAFAGKKVDTLPILISIGIFLITMVVVVSIIYSLIHSSIISVGRNPMSQAAVYRNVIQLSVLVLVILGVAVGAIYMVLRGF